MDSAMSSPVTQIAAPFAAGLAGSRGGGAGVNAALNTAQFLQRQAADKRIRELFAEQQPYSEPGQNVAAAAAGSTPKAATRVGSYIDNLNRTVAQGGMAALGPAMRAMTSLHNTTTRYEQPQVDEGNIIQGGAVTGIAPAQAAKLDQDRKYNQSRTDLNRERIQEVAARTGLTEQKVTTEGVRRSEMRTRIEKIQAETDKIINKVETEGRGVEGLTLQLDRVKEAMNDPETTPEAMEKLLRIESQILDRLEAQHKATEAKDPTEEGATESDPSLAKTVPSHKSEGMQATKTGQVYDYVPGQGLRPRG